MVSRVLRSPVGRLVTIVAVTVMVGITGVAYACVETDPTHTPSAAAPTEPASPAVAPTTDASPDEAEDVPEQESAEPDAAPAAVSGDFYNYLPGNAAAKWVAANPGDPRAKAIADKMGSVPQADWFGGDGPQDQASVDKIVTAAAAAGKIALLVMYNIPNRDGCKSGGAGGLEAYRTWVDHFTAGIKGRAAWVVVEPDATAQECMNADRGKALSYAINKAKDAGATVFLDAGNLGWHSTAEQVGRLKEIDLTKVDGIAVNVSSFQKTDAVVAYAQQVLAGLGLTGRKILVDTSRNGAGMPETWCDPKATIKIGQTPKIDNPVSYAWIKGPGTSDGCSSPAGTFDPAVAYRLAS